MARYATRLELRDLVNAKLEEQRQAKVIGTSLEAAITLAGTGRFADALAGLSPDDLAAFCIVSDATVVPADAGPGCRFARRDGESCRRREVPAMLALRAGDQHGRETEGLCDRCADALGLGSWRGMTADARRL